MLNKASMNELTQAERIAYFRAELNLCSPEGSSLDEKKEIYNEMMDTSMALLDAMRADFEQLPPAERERLLDILIKQLENCEIEAITNHPFTRGMVG